MSRRTESEGDREDPRSSVRWRKSHERPWYDPPPRQLPGTDGTAVHRYDPFADPEESDDG